MLVLTDLGSPDPDTAAAIRRWVEDGGVLLRFAEPRLAREPAADDPAPAAAAPPRRADDRRDAPGSATGKLWHLFPWALFAGYDSTDLRVDRQVIAEPSLDTAERTWASLETGHR